MDALFDGYLVAVAGCDLVTALVMAVCAPFIARGEYRKVQGHWPQAVWIGRLTLISIEGMCLWMLVAGIPLLLNSIGNSPLVSFTDARWAWLLIPLAVVGSLMVVALFGLVALTIAQRLRYGLPPRTPPT